MRCKNINNLEPLWWRQQGPTEKVQRQVRCFHFTWSHEKILLTFTCTGITSKTAFLCRWSSTLVTSFLRMFDIKGRWAYNLLIYLDQVKNWSSGLIGVYWLGIKSRGIFFGPMSGGQIKIDICLFEFSETILIVNHSDAKLKLLCRRLKASNSRR